MPQTMRRTTHKKTMNGNFRSTMKRLFHTTVTFLAFITIACAQEMPAELVQLKVPYVQAVTTIRANADARAKPFVTSYLAVLDRLLQQSANDPVLSVPVAAERDRVAAGKAPTAEERAKMGVQLQQLRAKFDADILKTKAPFVQQEAQYSRQYLSSLGALERRFTAQNAIPKAAAVQAENQRVSADLGLVPAGEKPKVVADSTITAGKVKALGTLDVPMADKVAAAAKAKSYTRTANSKQGAATEGGIDVPEDGGLLIGFEFYQTGKDNWIQSLRPYFITRQGIVPGKDRGKMKEVTEKVMARPGYAVSGMLISAEKEIQLIFSKINEATGQLATDPASTYKSQVYGKKTREKAMLVGGDGRPVIGVYGRTGSDADDLGLVMMNKAP